MPNATSSARRPGWRGIIVFSVAVFLLVLTVLAARLQFGHDPALGQLTAQTASARSDGVDGGSRESDDEDGGSDDGGGILSAILGGGSDGGGTQSQPAAPTTRSS